MATPTRQADKRRGWIILASLCFVSVAAYAALTGIFISDERERTPQRAAFFAQTVDNALARLDHLPFIVASDARVQAALTTGQNIAPLNNYLSEIAARANAEVVYVMDTVGLTIAASNHDTEGSFVGQFYTFRPYFRDAMNGTRGHYFAVGVTTGRPGYFVSDPVFGSDGSVIGVAVIKIGLASITDAWSDSGDQILVTDTNGIILAAASPDIIFGTIAALPDALRQSIAEQRQFADFPLRQVDWHVVAGGRVTLDGTTYLLTEAAIAREGWTLHLLSSVTGIRLRALLYVAVGLAGLLALGVAATLFRSERLNRALQASNADRLRLGQEIDERRRAETQLRDAQAELARSSRLAALGQLAASITHELGQPISAMRNYLTAEDIAGDAPASPLVTSLSGIVDRMQSITDQLRFFATPSRRDSERIDLCDVVKSAAQLVAHDFDASDVTLVVAAPDPVFVRGVRHRLEQVVVNMLRNAMHSTQGAANATVSISVAGGNSAQISVRDTGAGLGGRAISELTEPFMTTKSSGQGMGLGLAISDQIVKDHQGTLTASDAPDGGAIFVVTIPLDQNGGRP